MINVILLHSDRPSIGKSTFANSLSKDLNNSEIISFAAPIKYIAYQFYLSQNEVLFGPHIRDINYSEFCQKIKDQPLEKTLNKTPRDITIEISDLIQRLYGPDIWARTAYDVIQKIECNAIFDDWRRPNESDYFSNKEDINLIKVFLSKKERRQKERLSDTSESYEGLIRPEDADIVFEFNEDWSNSDQLKELILNAIV